MEDFVTEEQVMEQTGIKDPKTIKRMIRDGELPDFTYGNSGTAKKKGWHKAVLRHHSLIRLIKNVRRVG